VSANANSSLKSYDIVFLGKDAELYSLIRNILKEFEFDFYRSENLDDFGKLIAQKCPRLILLSSDSSSLSEDENFNTLRTAADGKIPMFLFTKTAAEYRNDGSFGSTFIDNLKKVWQESALPKKPPSRAKFMEIGKTHNEKRKFTRISVKTPVLICEDSANGFRTNGFLRNLSAGGISVNSKEKISDSGWHLLGFSLAQGKTFKLRGVKTRDSYIGDHWHTAFRFEKVNSADSDDIDEYACNLIFLRKLRVFSEFDAEDLIYIMRTGKKINIPSGSIIFSAGTPGRNFYVVFEGKIKIFRMTGALGAKKEKFLAFIHPGEFFGEMALLMDIERSGSAQAVENSTLFQINRESLDELLTSRSDIAVKLYRSFISALVERLNTTDQELIDSPFTTPLDISKM